MKTQPVCECGHVHCCHKKAKKEELLDDSEGHVPFRFVRETCTDCGQFLGDEFLEYV
jgi:hypothetical protein